MQESASPASKVDPYAEAEERPRPRRWRWLWVLGVLAALRLALPVVLGPAVEERLSRALGTRVEVGDVSFAPIDAVLTLRSVSVHHPGEGSAQRTTTPAIDAPRVRLDLQWLPLLHRSLVVRELTLESARIDVERSADGRLSLEPLLHADPGAQLPPGWSFALDRVVLRDSHVRVRGLQLGPAPLEVAVRDAEVATRRRRATVFGRAPNLHLDVAVDGGRLRVDGTSDLRDDGVVVDALLRVKDVPLERLQGELPDLGWTSLTGRLSGQLHYQRDPGRRDLLSGRLRARRIAVAVPTFDGPALTVRRAEAEVDAIDLRQRRLAIGALTLHGARLAVRPDLAAPVPLLDGVSFASPRAGKRGRPAPPASGGSRWSWSIASLAMPFARLQVVGSEPALMLAASVSGESLGPAAYWSPVRGWVERGGGVATFDGTARMTRGFAIDGRLTAGGIDAGAFARAVGLPFADLVQAGVGGAELTFDLEPGAAEGPPVDVRGKVVVAGPWLAGPEADAFALGADAIELTLAGIAPASEASGGARSATLRFTDATVREPYALVTRTADGWLLPPFAVEPAPVEEPRAATSVALASASTVGGRILLVDRSAEPPLVLDVALLEGWAREVRLPEPALAELVLQGSETRFGALQLAGRTVGATREIDLSAQSVPLADLSPYLQQAGLPYGFSAGTGSFLARVTVASGRWAADTALALHEPRLTGDDTRLRRSLGMPIETALAELRDDQGDVTLRLSLASQGEDGTPAVEEVVASAVREAVARARRAPLPERPIEIAFAPGRAELGSNASRQLAAIAELLEARRDAVVELAGMASREDARWIAEQSAASYLGDEPGGLAGVLRAFGVRDQDARIRDALAARRAGLPGRLDADDEEALRELVAAGPPVDEHRLAALAAARSTRIASVLVERHGVSPARIVVADPGRQTSPGPPVVQARIGVDDRPLRSAARAEARPW